MTNFDELKKAIIHFSSPCEQYECAEVVHNFEEAFCPLCTLTPSMSGVYLSLLELTVLHSEQNLKNYNLREFKGRSMCYCSCVSNLRVHHHHRLLSPQCREKPLPAFSTLLPDATEHSASANALIASHHL